MKHFAPILIFSLLFITSLSAQEESRFTVKAAPKVTESIRNMSQGAHHAFSLFILNTDDKRVEKEWKDLMKDYNSKPKNVKKSDDMMAEGVQINSISGAGTMNIYTQIGEQGDDVVFTAWFDMGDGRYLNSADYPNTYEEAVQFLASFATRVKRNIVQEELDNEEKELKKLERDQERLVREKENLEKDIENFTRRIEEAKEKIQKNVAEQEANLQNIEAQKGKVQEVNTKLKGIQ